VTAPATARWTTVAHLLRPQGRRGELLAEPQTDLAEVFTNGREVWLAPFKATSPADSAASITLEEHFFPTGKNAGRIVLKLSGCDSITQAEALAGKQIMVLADALPTLDPDTFFVGDLLGCALYDGDTLIGKVIDVHFATTPDGRTRLEDAAPLLVIELPLAQQVSDDEDAEPILIPFVHAWLVSVDPAAKRITMNLPAGLLDAEE